MPKPGLLGGRKITKNHSSIITDAVKVIEHAKTLPQVKMLVPAEIVRLKPATRHIKFSSVPAGLKMAIRGMNNRQLFYIYTTEPRVVEELITKYWQKLF